MTTNSNAESFLWLVMLITKLVLQQHSGRGLHQPVCSRTMPKKNKGTLPTLKYDTEQRNSHLN